MWEQIKQLKQEERKKLKPQNSFIQDSHLPKIWDFGLCPPCPSYPGRMERWGSVQMKLNVIPRRLIEHECSALIQTTNTAALKAEQ